MKNHIRVEQQQQQKNDQIVCTNMVQFLNLIMNYTKEMYGEYYDIGQQGQGGNGRSNIIGSGSGIKW